MKRDRRERRVRNTLTVDLGMSGLPLLDACMDSVRSLRLRRCKVSGRPLKRSEVIRIALHVLHLVISGVPQPVDKAMEMELEMRARLQ